MAKTIDKISQVPMDCYQVANEMFGAHGGHAFVAEAVEAMSTAGWTFLRYNDDGEEVHQPPAKCPVCGGIGGAIGSGLDSDAPCHSGPYK